MTACSGGEEVSFEEDSSSDVVTNPTYIKAVSSAAGDQFGTSVAISSDGSTLAVGAINEDATATDSGAVSVYTRSGDTWVLQRTVKAGTPGAGDQFGVSVALSADGNTLAVGANLEDGTATDSGAVYVFTRTNGSWGDGAYIKAGTPVAGDQFGVSVALSADGSTLAVGANFADAPYAGNGGAVYVYTRTNGNWGDEAYLTAIYKEGADEFGYSVALSGDGNTLAVGVRNDDSDKTGIDPVWNVSASGSGAVNVFTRTNGSWGGGVYIKATNTDVADRFGTSVALSADGNTLAVGAVEEDGSGTGINPDASDNSAADAGAVYVYTRTNGTWSSDITYIKAGNTGAGDQFGKSVALSSDGNTLAVGANVEGGSGKGINPADNDAAAESGAVYVYTRINGTWSNDITYIKAGNTGAGDHFGTSVALSSDAGTLAVGASSEDGSGSGINPADNDAAAESGAAYVSSNW